jgi:hypothetical protein
VGKILSKASGFAGSRADLLHALEQNEDGLQEIAENFGRICDGYVIKSFYESNKLLGVKKVCILLLSCGSAIGHLLTMNM